MENDYLMILKWWHLMVKIIIYVLELISVFRMFRFIFIET